MTECPFCNIANNNIPSFKLFEDDLVIAFLDINPVSNGHILVISKKHFENIFETPEEVLNRINQVCKKMAMLCKEKLKATGVNIINASGKDAQQSVFHIHFHVIPRFKDDDINLWFHGQPVNLDNARNIQQKLLE